MLSVPEDSLCAAGRDGPHKLVRPASTAIAAAIYDGAQCKGLWLLLQLCRDEKAPNAHSFGGVDCRTRFLMVNAQVDDFVAEKNVDHQNARTASNMLRHKDNIRLTKNEKTTLDTVAGYRKDAPKTVDELNARLDAAAQVWDAGESPEERLAAALAIDMKLEPMSRPIPVDQALAPAPDSDR